MNRNDSYINILIYSQLELFNGIKKAKDNQPFCQMHFDATKCKKPLCLQNMKHFLSLKLSYEIAYVHAYIDFISYIIIYVYILAYALFL